MSGSVCVLQGEVGWGIGVIQVVIHGDKCFIGVCRRTTVSYLKKNEHIVLGAKKCSKTLAVHELYEDLIIVEIWGDILIV